MIEIQNVQTLTGRRNHRITSQQDLIIDGTHLLLLPGLIDPHVHFRTPGMEYKEDWQTAAKASIHGGYTTVFDMPNTIPPCITKERLQDKKRIIDGQLQAIDIPLRYQLFFGADKHHFAEIPKVKGEVVGIKVFMGSSTGDLLMDDDESLHRLFALAAENDLLVAIHAEDEQLIQQRKKLFLNMDNYAVHSQIRNSEVAASAVAKVISLCEQYGTRVYILHVSTAAELALIQVAKQKKLPIFAETTPHHLFLNETAYEQWRGKAKVNPPLRTQEDQAALMQAIQMGVIDTIGSDHAPHTEGEKAQAYCGCPAGMPGIETTLPLLLNAYHHGLLSLAQITVLTSTRAQEIFQLADNEDAVLIDLKLEKMVTDSHLKTKCGWSPYAGLMLKGWPTYTILQGRVFPLA